MSNVHEVIHKVKYGKVERVSFSKIKETLEIPYFIALQKDSYKQFMEEGIGEVLKDFSPIRDHSGKMELHFLGYTLDGKPKYDVKECKNRDTTYAIPLKVKVRLVRHDTGEMTDTEVFMGEFPLMTENGSFIINGAERAIVSQLVRSPGIYCNVSQDRNGTKRYETTVIPNRGAWLEFKQDAQNILWVNVDKNRKITASTLVRALGFSSNDDLYQLFGKEQMLIDTIAKDTTDNGDDAKIELFKRLKNGEVPTIENVTALINNTFFDDRKYDTQRVGRYKFNKKLSFESRLVGHKLTTDVVTEDGEVVAKKGELLDAKAAKNVANSGVSSVNLLNKDGGTFKMISNRMVDLDAYVPCKPRELGVLEKVYYPELVKLMAEYQGEALINAIKENIVTIVPEHITLDDIISTINYNLGLCVGFGEVDNIDHLSNRRVRSVGELLQNQLRVGLSRLEKVIKERMSTTNQDDQEPNAQSYINIKPVTSVIKEFFCSSQLSQFMDQHNPIAELTHKRKLSALGPGGLNRERAGFDVRDVHHSH